LRAMTPPDLEAWCDGTAEGPSGPPPDLARSPEGLRLWAVRPVDVVHALEGCGFGHSLESQVIKHTNLTGGEAAHCAGELVLLGNDTVALNGGSGRYGPTSEEEMNAVAKAFKESGYGVWSYGYDVETARPFRFGSRLPEWVQ
jgi:hypothetical protein